LNANHASHRQNSFAKVNPVISSPGKNEIEHSIGYNLFNIAMQFLGKLVIKISAKVMLA